MLFDYNSEEKKVQDAIKQLYRDFAIKYNEINKQDIPEREKEKQEIELIAQTQSTEEILLKTKNLSEISNEDKELLGIKEVDETVDENSIDVIVGIFEKRLRIPDNISFIRDTNEVLDFPDEKLQNIDTESFKQELKEYFTEHYNDLTSTGYSKFLANVTNVPIKGITDDEYGDVCKIAIKHNFDPGKFRGIGNDFAIQNGFVAVEPHYGEGNVIYATPEGLNNRIFDLYSEALFMEKAGKNFRIDETRRLKNGYITYAEEHEINIENKDALETLDVDMEKVDKIAEYIHRVLNERDSIITDDLREVYKEDIIKNYSKIMNLKLYNFGQLESVKRVIGDTGLFDELYLSINEDSIVCHDHFSPDIAYGTPEFVKKEYEKIMEKVKVYQEKNLFQDLPYDLEKLTRKKHAYRRYIKENGIEGIDISVPDVEVDHEKTNMITDAIMEKYANDYEDKEGIRAKILNDIESKWPELITESQVMGVKELIKDELEDLGIQRSYIDDDLYVKDGFIYLGDSSGYNAKIIYATEEALTDNLKYLNKRIAKDPVLSFDENRKKEVFAKYISEHDMDIDINSTEKEADLFTKEELLYRELAHQDDGFMRSIKSATNIDDPTARPKINLEDNLFDCMYKLSEGNPGAMKGVEELFHAEEDKSMRFMLLLDLDDMNIRGSQVWQAYKYLYNEDAKKFAEAVKNRDKDMVDFINQELATVGGEKAVTSGASFDRSSDPNKYRFTEEDVKELEKAKEQRLERQRETRDEMIANSPAKKYRGKKQREEREAKKQAYRQRLINSGKRSIKELDDELTELKSKEQQAKNLYNEYEEQLPDKPEQEV